MSSMIIHTQHIHTLVSCSYYIYIIYIYIYVYIYLYISLSLSLSLSLSIYIYIYIYIFLIEEQGIFVTQNLNIFCFLIIIYRSLIEKNTARVVAAHQNNVLLLWRGIVLFACHIAREAREL